MVVTSKGRASRRSGASDVVVLAGAVVEEAAVVELVDVAEADAGRDAESSPQAEAVKLRTTRGMASR
jgi:hypothetical protein